MNLFLPPFPEAGLTLDYVDKINLIFDVLANHTHQALFQQPFSLPNGNRIESDSIFWTNVNTESNILNVKSAQFYNEVILIPIINYLSVRDGNLHYTKSGVGDIQITNGPYVNASATITGFIGDFQTYGVNLLFDTISNSYTFSSNAGSIGINVNTLTATNVNLTSLETNILSLTNAPNLTPNNDGLAYFNSDGIFIYSEDKIIRLNNTTSASTYVFDNMVRMDGPPIGFPPYPRVDQLGSNDEVGVNIFTTQSFDTIQFLRKWVYADIWFPLSTPDNKQIFYGELFQDRAAPEANMGDETVRIWRAETGSGTATNTIAINYDLNKTGWETCRIDHYGFVLDENSALLPPNDGYKYVRSSTDYLIEHTVGTFVEKNINVTIKASGMPINQTTFLSYNFNFLFDFGTQVI